MSHLHGPIREYWDRDSATYDRSPGHAASDPIEAAAWRSALAETLPPSPARVLDVGAGTGALALLAVELGYEVTAVDISDGMLARARDKAAARGLELSTIVGTAEEPPLGPFDAVIERHVVWTLPDPPGALRAWREVVRPGGRLVLFEAIWGRTDAVSRLRRRGAEVARALTGTAHDHHAPYPPDVLRDLPLARLPSVEPLVRLAEDTGWRAVRFRRLRDVEWARRLQDPWVLAALEHMPRYVLVAEA